ncbi:beta-hexosaminidase [uncultured Roseburia sp.]|uniref:beta-N-acetylhexosaminidase n=1 Tax=Brotonthovivens ammoniilytica TaxID=2981725 RepID=A0ABT2TGW4_9FIRM|nr:glycoside hydrolase family 3 N-terminal domain-containing protein [Brotonthovivens ammoniilytica]MCU6760966.1 beta-hexosaminidase [Brotonthovivens ammoniilytica]SCI14869.1 beta-hexosaminidase [uncultured Roseburia sp.]
MKQLCKLILAAAALAVLSGAAGCSFEGQKTDISVSEKEKSRDEALETGVHAENQDEIRARALLDEMSLEEKVGQMFFVRCPKENAAKMVTDYHIGGYLLFGQDFEENTPKEARENIQSYQEASEIPLLIGVDEEGGTVNRISRYPQFRKIPFLSPMELYEQGGLNAIEQDAQEKCEFLQELGINVNFAPVCDVSENPDDFIYQRTLGQGAEETAEYVKAVTAVMKDKKMASVLKHFPGYGNNTDTHTGIAYDKRPLKEFETSDFLPFQGGIDAGADLVLVSHNIVECMDETYPASLSEKVHRILREELGFTGVIITDDLVMDGVKEFAGQEQAAVLAVKAGNDLLCCTDFEVQIPAVLEAVKSGEISRQQIDESVLRVLRLKINLGLL